MTLREMFEDEQLLEDLEWSYNVRKEDWKLSDIKRLYALVNTPGGFYTDNCDHCRERYIRSNYEDVADFYERSFSMKSDDGIGDLCEECTSLYISLKQSAGEY